LTRTPFHCATSLVCSQLLTSRVGFTYSCDFLVSLLLCPSLTYTKLVPNTCALNTCALSVLLALLLLLYSPSSPHSHREPHSFASYYTLVKTHNNMQRLKLGQRWVHAPCRYSTRQCESTSPSLCVCVHCVGIRGYLWLLLMSHAPVSLSLLVIVYSCAMRYLRNDGILIA
jgi:hypothetical protein